MLFFIWATGLLNMVVAAVEATEPEALEDV